MITIMIPRRISTESNRGGFAGGTEENGTSIVGVRFVRGLAMGGALVLSAARNLLMADIIFTSSE